ncbi:hypothetical protein [Streptomyces chryseus]
MTPPESTTVALELAEIRRSVDVGFTKTDGSLALLVQRSEQTDKQLIEHDTRITALERSRWPLPSLAVLTSLAALGTTLYGLTSR